MFFAVSKNKAWFFAVLWLAFFCFSAKALASPAINLRAFPDWNKIRVEWRGDYILDETQSAVVIRKKGTCPKNPSDGEEVYRGNGNFFEDGKIAEGTIYCYGVMIARLSGGAAAFSVGEPVKSLQFREYRDDLIGKLGEKINRFILAELFVLTLVFWLYRRRQKKALLRDKFRVIRTH